MKRDAHPFLAAMKPVAKALDATIVSPSRMRASDIPLEWQGELLGGLRMPDLQGTYFFAEYCSDWIDTFRLVGGVATAYQRLSLVGNSPVSFGEDGAGELYIINQGGSIFRFEP